MGSAALHPASREQAPSWIRQRIFTTATEMQVLQQWHLPLFLCSPGNRQKERYLPYFLNFGYPLPRILVLLNILEMEKSSDGKSILTLTHSGNLPDPVKPSEFLQEMRGSHMSDRIWHSSSDRDTGLPVAVLKPVTQTGIGGFGDGMGMAENVSRFFFGE
jgi:hypothetical protein